MLGKRSMSFSGGEDELSDEEGSQAGGGEKKRRLNLEQVRTLEKNFELGNKLEPERKMQLAAALGLQPRQVAIWFQNRRARWKTKQLEKDFDALKRQFDAVRADNEALLAHNKQLQSELLALKGREAATTTEPINLNKETEGSCSNRSENSSDINLDISRPPTTDFFPSYRPPGVTQLLQSSPRPELQCPKAEHGGGGGVGQEESLCNMFYSVEDQSAFWAWSEQHNFHG